MFTIPTKIGNRPAKLRSAKNAGARDVGSYYGKGKKSVKDYRDMLGEAKGYNKSRGHQTKGKVFLWRLQL